MDLLSAAKTLPEELVMFVMAMLPLTELRASIPFGITVLHMSPWAAFAFSLAGNIFVALIILALLDPVAKFLRKHSKTMDRFFIWLFHRTRTKHTKRMSELGHLALLIFVAIPMPGSGGWTGALISYVFGVKSKISIPIISVGLLFAGIFVTFGTETLVNLFR